MDFLDKIQKLDRRIIFVFTALAVIVPLLFKTGIRVPVTNEVKSFYNQIAAIPPGEKILVSFDYDPQTKPECHPMAYALMEQAFRQKLKVVVMALWPTGASLAEEVLKKTSKKYEKTYGIDYVFLGYKTGGTVVIQKLCSSFEDVFPQDNYGKPISEFPLMRDIKSIKDVKAVVSLSSGFPGIKEWIMLGNAQTGVPVGGGCTAVSAPEFYPYLNSGQCFGLLGGMKGAAEYETLVGIKGLAVSGMMAQSVVHLLIIIFIILANVGYFYTKFKRS